MPPIHVLVIDDDEQLISFLQRALGYAGFTVSTATTGEAGLQQAALHLPDVVILDIALPDNDGLEVCRRLWAMSAVPILVLSAAYAVNDQAHRHILGASDYLPKPFALHDLIRRLRGLANR